MERLGREGLEAVRAEILALRRLLNRKGGQALDRLRDEVAQYKDHQIAEAKAFVASVAKVLDDLLDRERARRQTMMT